MMKRLRLYVLHLCVFLFGLFNYALAADTIAAHVITIRVEPVAVIALVGTGGQNCTRLVVDSAGVITGSQELKWTTNLEGMRVTVQSNLPTDEQDYILRVRAVDLNSKGTSKGWGTITDEPSNLITGIVREIGGCCLEYEASPKINGKPGRNKHIITYTITE
jgi:hypothetical protein